MSAQTTPLGVSDETWNAGLATLNLQSLRGAPLSSPADINAALMSGHLPGHWPLGGLPEPLRDVLRDFQAPPTQAGAPRMLRHARALEAKLGGDEQRLIGAAMSLGLLQPVSLKLILMIGCLMRALSSPNWDTLSPVNQNSRWTEVLRSAGPDHPAFKTQPDPELTLKRALKLKATNHLRELYLENLSSQAPETWPHPRFVTELRTLSQASGARPSQYPWSRADTIKVREPWGPEFLRPLLTAQRHKTGPKPGPLTLPDLPSSHALWGHLSVPARWNRQRLTLLIMATDAWGMKNPTREVGLLSSGASLSHLTRDAKALHAELRALIVALDGRDPLLHTLFATEEQLAPHLPTRDPEAHA